MKDWELLRDQLVAADESADHFGELAPIFEDYRSPLRKESEDALADMIEMNQYLYIIQGTLTEETVARYSDFFERHGIPTDLQGVVELKKAEFAYKEAQRALQEKESPYRMDKEMAFRQHCRNTRKLIGRQLRDAREARGFSIDEASEVSGINKGLISRLEAGRANVGIDTVATLARIYNTQLSIYG